MDILEHEKPAKCQLQIDSDWTTFSLIHIIKYSDYRVFFIGNTFVQQDFSKIHEITSKPTVKIRINEEEIVTVSRQRSFLEIAPGIYVISLHLQEYQENTELSWDPFDVHIDTDFFCEVGKTFVHMMIMIEPNPMKHPLHGHFHTTIICPKTRIVESPESDRCIVTELPCTFQFPVSKTFEDKITRQKEYGIQILQYGAYIEYYGSIKLKEELKRKGINADMKKMPHLDLDDIIRLLFAYGFIDNDTHSKLIELKKERNKLLMMLNHFMRYTL